MLKNGYNGSLWVMRPFYILVGGEYFCQNSSNCIYIKLKKFWEARSETLKTKKLTTILWSSKAGKTKLLVTEIRTDFGSG